jgi:hypothetical protein
MPPLLKLLAYITVVRTITEDPFSKALEIHKINCEEPAYPAWAKQAQARPHQCRPALRTSRQILEVWAGLAWSRLALASLGYMREPDFQWISDNMAASLPGRPDFPDIWASRGYHATRLPGRRRFLKNLGYLGRARLV